MKTKIINFLRVLATRFIAKTGGAQLAIQYTCGGCGNSRLLQFDISQMLVFSAQSGQIARARIQYHDQENPNVHDHFVN